MIVEDCSHRPPCPGCPSYGASMETTHAFAALQAFGRARGADVSTLSDHPLGYRHRARLAVRGRVGSPKIGIFQLGSHRIADIPRCGIHHPAINRTAAAVRDAMGATGSVPYADGPHRGLVRYLQIAVSPATAQVQLVVVVNDTDGRAASPLLEQLVARLGAQLHSLAWNAQPERSNAILGSRTEVVHGPRALALPFGGALAHFPPAAFMQNNLPLYARIVERVHAWVPDGARVVEYYAGVGAIGLGLAARCAHVGFNELSPASLEGLALGLAALPDAARERTWVHAGDAGEHVGALAGADTAIVDPPRRGLDAPLLQALCERPVDSLIYVSCGLDSFQRDASALVDGGHYRLDTLVAADLFPFTGHIETLARFRAA